ncbi:biopolymer transporter ExbD (plasmid) [Falsihalocynthiibacter sp. SS001]|uniref:biopolymer transporter ExbD n=1 Tax=Falsihalocynthiibacter sp. SS001 TaxID=3349698 RepID=UPI0036D288F6
MPRVGAKRRGRLSMTSLIDVIFLLLLFFMLSSTFSKFGEIELRVNGASAAPFSDSPVVFARLDATSLRINGREVNAENVEQAVEPHRRGERVTLLLSVTSDASAQALADALRTLARVPDADFSVME